MLSLVILLLVVVLILGCVGLAAGPSPSFGALSLALGAVGGCCIIMCYGETFLSLVLFLIYMGGTIVVFVYSIAFARSLGSEGWNSHFTLCAVMVYLLSVAITVVFFVNWDLDDFQAINTNWREDFLICKEFIGISYLYSAWSLVLATCGWGLLVVLFGVLKFVRGICMSAICGRRIKRGLK